MYGAQTACDNERYLPKFENDVEMYGAQTFFMMSRAIGGFENDVEMYGAQTRLYGMGQR